MRYLCDCCKKIVKPITRYDYSPAGDDVDFCPECGATDCFGMPRWELINEFVNDYGITIKEVRCPECGCKETYSVEAPKRCYICNLELWEAGK